MAKRTAVSQEMRRQVAERADYLCEYCLIAESDTFFGCHVDHIISVKHGGLTTIDNLAYACVVCNRQKGSDLGSINWETRNLVRFFNPRSDRWSDHFYLQKERIASRTPIGDVTARILGFNSDGQVIERQTLIAESRYPSSAAMRRMEQS
jgi:hypothetical protein